MQKDLIRTRQLRFTSLLTALLLLLMMMPMSVWADSYTIPDSEGSSETIAPDTNKLNPGDTLNFESPYNIVKYLVQDSDSPKEVLSEDEVGNSYEVKSVDEVNESVKEVEAISIPEGQRFGYWEISSINNFTGNQYRISLLAVFVAPHTITVDETENGTVTVSTTSAIVGDPITVTATPATGYKLGEVTATYEKEIVGTTEASSGTTTVAIELAEGKTEGSYSFEMPDADVTVSATFVEKTYAIEIESNNDGSITTDPAREAKAGTKVTVNATPNDSETKELDEITVKDSTGATIATGSSFTMPASDVIVSATFKAVETSEPAVDTTGSAVDTTGSAVDTTGSAVVVVDPTETENNPYIITIGKITGSGDVYLKDGAQFDDEIATGPVTVVASAAAGYLVDSFTYESELTSGSSTGINKEVFEFQLTTPGSYKISVVFKEDKQEETNNGGSSSGSSASSEPSFPFTDVTEDDWGYDAIYWLWKQGITDGTSSSKYSPNGAVTRAMGAVLLHRAAGTPAAGLSPFIDVPESSYYAKAVGWGYENGCIYGTAPEYYRPARNITREEFAAILYRYMQSQGKGFTGAWMYQIGFADADQISEYAYEAMCWMTQNGVFEGYSDNTVRPQNIITRREAAVMLYRLWNLK